MKIKPRTEASLLGMLFTLPTLAFIIFFGIIPIISSVKYSFTDWDGVKALHFVGLQNYITALTEDKVFIRAIFNTLLLTSVCVILNLIIGLALANFLFRLRGRTAEFGKIVLFIPYILSFAAVGVLFSFIFGTTDLGLLNQFLSLFGVEPFAWLGSVYTAMPSIIVTYVWKDFGFALLLYYAALQSMPASLLEAADMDGASEWQKTRFVKIPYLASVTQMLVVLGVIRYMLTFTMIMFLTPDGGPSKTTEMAATWFYKQSFNYMEFGYGSSLAVILTVILMVLTLILRRILKTEEA